MKIGRMAAAALLAAALTPFAQGAHAENARIPVRIYAAETALDRAAAKSLAAQLAKTFPQGDFTVEHESQAGSLRDMVMADCAPQLALCAPQEARMWAAEGMLAPLDSRIAEPARMQEEVASACTQGDWFFMAPLAARHRHVAVNARLLHQVGLGTLLDDGERTIWYPQQLNLVLEEFAMRGAPAMDVWLPGGGGDAPAALVQAVYGGILQPQAGTDMTGLCAGLTWLQEMTEHGYIRLAQGREEALRAFLAGETALFIDWQDGDDLRYARLLQGGAVELALIPFPSLLGTPVRSWELTGAAVFLSDDPAQTALALEAAAFLGRDAAAQKLLGKRQFWTDGAVWLPDLSAHPQGATLCSLLGAALCAALSGEEDAADAADVLRAAVLALP